MVRYKNRYFLLEWKFPAKAVGHRMLKGENSRNLLKFFKEKMQLYHGDYGVACVQHSLSVKYHNWSTMMTMVRCPRAHYPAVWSALCGITSYKKEPCSLSVLHLSGTIRSVQRFLVQHNTTLLRKEMSGADQLKREETETKLRRILKPTGTVC